MHLVILAPEGLPVPPTQGGSVQIYIDAVCQRLAKQKNALTITLISPVGPMRLRDIEHIVVEGKSDAYFSQALRHLRRIRPDIVQIENRPVWVNPTRRAVPAAKIVLNLHSLTFLGPRHLPASAVRSALRKANAVVTNSRYLRRTVERQFHLSAQQWHPHVIFPGVDVETFTPPHREDTKISRGTARPLRVLYAGRVIRQKGVHILVRAIHLLQRRGVPVHLTILGKTPPWEKAYGQSIRRLIHPLPAQWPGFIPPQDMPKRFWKADVLVCPSQFREAFGMVNVEALAAGLPVVASKLGGIQEIVDETCGVLVPDFHNPEAFAKVLASLQKRPQRRATLRKGALQRAAQFDWDFTARRFYRLYQSLTQPPTTEFDRDS